MKKRNITALTLVAIAGLSLVGCGTTNDKQTEGNSTQVETQVQNAKTPEKIVEEFAKAVFGGDYEKALTMIEMPEGSIRDSKALENCLLKMDIEPVKIKSIKTEVIGNEDTREVKVVVTTKDGDTIDESFYAVLNDNNKWSISSKDLAIEDWEIVVPKGSTVSLNGSKLAVKPETKKVNAGEKNEMIYDVYKIPAIIKGNYDLKVEHPLAKTSDESKVYPGASKEVSLELNDETLKKAEDGVRKLLSTISSNATEGKDFGELLGVVVSEKSNGLASIQETYKELVAKLTTNYKVYNYYNYKDLGQSNVTITKATYNGDNTVYLEGSYEAICKERYASNESRLAEANWHNINKKLDFKVIFEVDKEGNFLQLEGQNIFSQIQ